MPTYGKKWQDMNNNIYAICLFLSGRDFFLPSSKSKCQVQRTNNKTIIVICIIKNVCNFLKQ